VSNFDKLLANLDLPREKIKVLFQSPDRANIYQQRRMLKQPVDVMNMKEHLSFVVPAILDTNFRKCQLFCSTRFTTDIVCSWLKSELNKLRAEIPHSILVEKLTGDNTREEKGRVMELFQSGECQVLICTDVCGMGLDVKDLNFSVSIGLAKNCWKMKQQSGRLGRGGEQSIDITLVFPQKGCSAPEPALRKAMKDSPCIRSALNELFVLSNPLVDYSAPPIRLDCQDAGCELSEVCLCSGCKCCSGCTDSCECPRSIKDPNSYVGISVGAR